MGQDHQGYLEFQPQEMKMQLQRHHVPGTLFFAPEAGDMSIMDPSPIPPDVCYRLVDAKGQDFVRCHNLYDLRRTVEIGDGQSEASIKGIDGDEITFKIAGEKQIRIEGKGMPKDWEGTKRGDLIVELLIH